MLLHALITVPLMASPGTSISDLFAKHYYFGNGIVSETTTNSPIAGASVAVFDDKNNQLNHDETDDIGDYNLRVPTIVASFSPYITVVFDAPGFFSETRVVPAGDVDTIGDIRLRPKMVCVEGDNNIVDCMQQNHAAEMARGHGTPASIATIAASIERLSTANGADGEKSILVMDPSNGVAKGVADVFLHVSTSSFSAESQASAMPVYSYMARTDLLEAPLELVQHTSAYIGISESECAGNYGYTHQVEYGTDHHWSCGGASSRDSCRSCCASKYAGCMGIVGGATTACGISVGWSPALIGCVVGGGVGSAYCTYAEKTCLKNCNMATGCCVAPNGGTRIYSGLTMDEIASARRDWLSSPSIIGKLGRNKCDGTLTVHNRRNGHDVSVELVVSDQDYNTLWHTDNRVDIIAEGLPDEYSEKFFVTSIGWASERRAMTQSTTICGNGIIRGPYYKPPLK